MPLLPLNHQTISPTIRTVLKETTMSFVRFHHGYAGYGRNGRGATVMPREEVDTALWRVTRSPVVAKLMAPVDLVADLAHYARALLAKRQPRRDSHGRIIISREEVRARLLRLTRPRWRRILSLSSD
jgi:hypothetical protein